MSTIIFRKLKNGTIKSWKTPGNFRNAKIERSCECCGKQIFVFPCQLKNGRGRYCSMSCAKKGKPSNMGMLGKKQSEDFKLKRKINWLGKNNPNWNGGVSALKKYVHYKNIEYKNWRRLVFERDDYTCQNCGKSGCYIHPHHLKSYTFFPEMRYVVDNGKTLCVPCHKQIHFS